MSIETFTPLMQHRGMRNMSEVPGDLHYTESHEWIRIEGNRAVVGITDYAQNALTDVVWVELAEIGAKVGAMEPCASVESVKSVSEIYAPVAGEIVEANEALEDAPEVINQDAYGEGWIFVLSMDDISQVEGLLDAATYSGLIGD